MIGSQCERRVLVLDRRHESTGGTHRYLAGLIPALHRANFEVEIALNECSGVEAFRDRMRRNGALVHSMPIDDLSPSRLGRWLSAFLSEREPAVLHVNCHAKQMRAGLLSMRRSRAHKYKTLFTMHGAIIMNSFDLLSSWKKFAPFSFAYNTRREMAGFIRFFDKGISVSNNNIDLVQRCLGVSLQRFSYIPNGVDTNAFSSSPNGNRSGVAIVIGTCARLAKEKRLDLLLRAFGPLAATDLRLQLRIAGDGPLEGELKTLSRELGIEDRVEFIGYCENVVTFLQDIDIFAMTSSNEGLPYSLLEAMSMCLPSVVPACNEFPAVVRDGLDGLLFEPMNVQDCSQKIAALCANDATRIRMGRSARQRVNTHYSEEQQMEKTADVFQALVES